VLALLGAALLAAAPAPVRAQAPDARWRTVETEHFRVHFPAGMEALGRRAAARAEVARAQLAEALVPPPAGKIELVVSDDTDYANGFATPFPYNRVVIYAHPPVDDLSLDFYDDWLTLVITHELVHVFHLDYARGPLKALRRVLGRNPIAFPNLAAPAWDTEGLATYLESRLTHAGRVRGTQFEMELRTAVLEDRFFGIGRASGDPVRWPAGATRYVYGSLFMDWLARRYGPATAGEMVRRVGGSLIPYRLDHHARQVYDDTTFTRAWEAWHEELRGRYAALADSLRREGITEPQVLTREGRNAAFPRWSPDGAWIAYAASTGRDAPSTRLLRADGGGEEVEVLARRTSLGPASWSRDGRTLLTAQLDLVDPYRTRSDLYRVRVAGREMDRLTHDARLLEPDLSPDGRMAVAVHSAGGAVGLVRFDTETGRTRELVPLSLDVHWSLPRWSPDGTRIAVGRWRRGGFFDVVVLDSAGRLLREATSDRAVDRDPAWSPDGRWVVFSSDRTGITNLFAFEVESGELRQVTNVLTGAFQPDVSPDGRWIAFSLYRADGYHLARIPFDPAAWRPAPPVRPAVADTVAEPSPPPAGGPVRRYSPWRTLAPRAWTPTLVTSDDVLGLAVGAAVASQDVVGRHLYAAWAQVHPRGGARVDGGASYQYRGLGNPVLGISALQDWDEAFGAGTVVTRAGDTIASAVLERERTLSLSATLVRPRYLSYGWVSGGLSLRDLHREWDRPEAPGAFELARVPLDAGAVVTAGYSTAQQYDFSISPERGWLASVTAEGRRYTEPFPGDSQAAGYSRLRGRLQGFTPLRLGGYARHVLAFRGVAGAEHGSRAPRIKVGGAGGLGSLVLLGGDLGLGDAVDFPVRGYDEGAQRGDRAFSATAEYRFPLALVEQGWRLFPAWLGRTWGTAFVDAGSAWCVESCDPGAFRQSGEVHPLVSVGTELGVQTVLGYGAPLTFRGGIAFPLSRVQTGAADGERPGPRVYLRLGRSF
jgi:Tol biopolymer transport system component